MAKPIPHSRAFEIQEDIAAFARSDEGFAHFGRQYFGWHRAMAERDHLDEDLLQFAHGTTTDEIQKLSVPSPTFCSRDYSLMLMTMAEEASENQGAPADIAPAGLLVFEDAFDFREVGTPAPITAVRAISWFIRNDPSNSRPFLFVRAWREDSPWPGTPSARGRTKLYPSGVMLCDAVPTSRRNPKPLMATPILLRLIQSHPALLRSPVASEAIEPRNTKISPRTKRSLAADSIRRVYLRHPEHARYEADEAAAAREGRSPVRAHWVRGHWRNQPYPRTGEVKWIWIDGYIKGNPENGTVGSRKLLVARATPYEVQELVCV